MLTCEIKVNGIMIHHIYINNRAESMHVDESKTPYYYEVYTPGRSLKSGNLIHNKGTGSLALIKKVLAKATKVKKRTAII